MMLPDTELLKPLLIPAIGGLVCYLLGKRARWLTWLIAMVASVWVLVVATRLYGHEVEPFQWILVQLDNFTLEISLGATPLTSFLLLFTGLFAVLISIYSLPYLARETNAGAYYGFSLWALMGATGAFMARDLLLLLIFWEVVTVMLFLLVTLGKAGAAKAAMKSFIILGASDAAILLGLAMIWVKMGTLNIDVMAFNLPIFVSGAEPWTYIAFLALFAGAIAKAGAFPLHTWLPAIAESAPTSTMAFLPASVDKLLGIYLLARIALGMFSFDGGLRLMMMIVGAVTILGAVMMAMVQHNLKKLLSFHAVSQVGYMVLGIGTGTAIGALGGLFHMLNNAIYKSALFLGAGSVERKAGSTDLDHLGGLARVLPITFLTMTVAALAISGVPPLNGFVSKWMVYRGVMLSDTRWAPVLLTAAVFGSALTLASFVKVLHSLFWQLRPKGLERLPGGERWFMALPMLVLAILCIIFGILAYIPINAFLLPALQDLGVADVAVPAEGGTISGIGYLWSPGLATILIIVGLIVGLLVYLAGTFLKIRVTSSFVGGEKVDMEKVRTSGTSFYETVREMPILRGALRDGESGAYDVYYAFGKFGGSLVRVLRSLHNGVLNFYAAWCIIGLAVIGIIVLYLMKGGG